MAKKTAAELAEARKAAAAERAEAARARAEAEAESERERAEHDARLRVGREKYRQLVSAARGMYDETDKLSRKWPSMKVTEHAVARTNKLLGETRDLLKHEQDLFIDGLADIVSAGDPPETRDVVLMLREATDALERYEIRYGSEWAELAEDDEEDDEDD